MGLFKKKLEKKKLIGFWACEHNFTFLDPIIEALSEDFRVEKFYYNGDNKLFKKQLNECDLAWFEWARGPIEAATAFNDIETPIICRLHKYEAYLGETMTNINWEKISTLIFIAGSVQSYFRKKYPNMLAKTNSVIIKNGIDLDKFKANLKRKRGKKIAFVGSFNYHKNPPFLLQCFYELLKKDANYRLFLAGAFIDPVIEEYFWYQAKKLKIINKIKHYGHVDNISGWLKDKDYFLQPSIIEGQSVASLEAMAMGLKPVLHNYSNSEKNFPKKYLFSNIEECVKSIESDDFNRVEYRKYIENNNNFKTQIEKIRELINTTAK